LERITDKNKMVTIKELVPGNDTIRFNAVVTKKDKRNFSNKPGSFLTFLLKDKTGEIKGQRWDDIDILDRLKEGDVVEAVGIVDEYRGKKQLNIKDLIPLNKFNPEDFIAGYTSQEIITALSYIESLMKTLKEPYLKKLWQTFRKDPDFWGKFRKAPAAMGFHHNKLGGLAVHTASVMRLCEDFIKQYDIVNSRKDMLLLGAMLHDAGKVREYIYDTYIGMSTEGRLLGHISIGLCMVEEKIKEIEDFPAEFEYLIKHLILSHHGQYEWGSPKRPKTLEAILLHFADNLDSKVEGVNTLIKDAKEDALEWTNQRYDGRNFLVDYKIKETVNGIRYFEQDLFE